MAAPVPATRLAPDGFMLRDGHVSKFTMSQDPEIELWETDVQPPGLDVGEPIDVSTQHNVNYRTFAAPGLVTLTPHTVVFGYDPAAYTTLLAMVGIDQTFTVLFPSLQTLAYYGYIQSAEFSPLVENEMPLVTLTIVPTNYDPVNCVEAGPVITGSGTC